jgi:Aminotransferase class-III
VSIYTSAASAPGTDACPSIPRRRPPPASRGTERDGTDACLSIPSGRQGAGGMVFVDPLFQRVMVRRCRSRGIPVIFDEVFSGTWRLGAQSAAQLLGVHPDIACYAKLLTGESGSSHSRQMGPGASCSSL